MTIISVNLSNQAIKQINRAAQALGMSRSKMFEYLIMNMNTLLPKTVLPLMDEIIELQEKVRGSLRSEKQ